MERTLVLPVVVILAVLIGTLAQSVVSASSLSLIGGTLQVFTFAGPSEQSTTRGHPVVGAPASPFATPTQDPTPTDLPVILVPEPSATPVPTPSPTVEPLLPTQTLAPEVSPLVATPQPAEVTLTGVPSPEATTAPDPGP